MIWKISYNTFFGGMLFATWIGLIVVGLINTFTASDVRSEWDGRCARTPAQAVGVVLEMTSPTHLKLAFDSGVIETYPITALTRIDCP